MSEDATLLQYIGDISDSLKDIRKQHTEAMAAHIKDDEAKHAELQRHINGLKTFRAVSVALGLVAAGGGGAIKAGVVDSVLQAVLK